MADHARPYLDLELRPGRSLSQPHFARLVGGVALLFALMSVRFLILGAWPILPFMVADVALLAWAMRASYRSSRQSEHLRLDQAGMELVHVNPVGMARRTRIEAARAGVELEPLRPRGNRLWISDSHQRIEIGRFLSPAERAEIAPVIARGLHRWRHDNHRRHYPRR